MSGIDREKQISPLDFADATQLARQTEALKVTIHPRRHQLMSRALAICLGIASLHGGFFDETAHAQINPHSTSIYDGGLGSGGSGSVGPDTSKSNSQNPEYSVPQAASGVVSRERIELEKSRLRPTKFAGNYTGKDEKGETEQVARESINELLAIAMCYEAGEMANSARDLNNLMSTQPKKNDNLANNLNKIGDYEPLGIAKLGVIAPIYDPNNLKDYPVGDPNTPLRAIIAVNEIRTTDNRTLFSMDIGIVPGIYKEMDPQDLGLITLNVKYVQAFIREALWEMDRKVANNEGLTFSELRDGAKDPKSDFNLKIKSQAMKAALETAIQLYTANPEGWKMDPEFAELFANYQKILPEGNEKVLQFTREYSANKK